MVEDALRPDTLGFAQKAARSIPLPEGSKSSAFRGIERISRALCYSLRCVYSGFTPWPEVTKQPPDTHKRTNREFTRPAERD